MVLAAGAGTRLRPLTDTVPKPMLPIGGQPLLAHTLRWLHAAGVREAALNLHYLPAVVRDGLGDGSRWGMHLRYNVEHELLGTAGALLPFGDFWDRTFAVIYGDLLLDLDLDALLRFHRQHGALVTIALKPTDTPRSQGMVEEAGGRVLRFVEKPQTWPTEHGTANAGVYIAEPAALRWIPRNRPSDWGHDIFPALLAADQALMAATVGGRVIDIGTPDVYRRVQHLGIDQDDPFL